jgi:hypothetical protein
MSALKWGGAAILLAAGLTAGAAFADVSGFLGSWMNSDSGTGGFLGHWLGPASDNSDIAGVDVTPAGPTHIRIHLFGRCKPALCDWGTQIGRNHSGDPGSDDVRSISANFDTGFALKHLTLRPGPGGSVRFDVVTDFTDRSGRHDYETSGSLSPAPAASPPLVASTPPPVGAPAEGAPAASAPGIGESASSTSVAMVEDCDAINPADVFVGPSERGWKLQDFNHTILNFGVSKVAAIKGQMMLDYYHIDEQCYIARPHPKMIYWRVGGQLPRGPMPGEDCVDVHPANVKAAQADGAWKVLDGSNTLIDYGEDRAGAEQAASVIRTYRLSRQCFVAKPDTTMVYWLAQ